MRKLFFLSGLLVCLIAANAAAQEPKRDHNVVVDINIVDVRLDRADELEKLVGNQNALNTLISNGKTRPQTGLQVRSRSGELVSAQIGTRVPVQIGSLPTLSSNTSFRNSGASVPQILYENVGLRFDATPQVLADGQIEVRFKLEQTTFDWNTGKLTPSFTVRSISEVVRVKPGQTSLLLGMAQPDGPQTLSVPPADRPASTAGVSFVVLLTARLSD